MGIEEDNIRKHTTPAYRAPEMWDLYRRELINEKVDIWALGCLLFRICYLKSAFDGDSKLQILNGNYRIPDLPKYSSFITDLIRELLQASPDARPDITQVWFRVNEQLPLNLQKSLPDRSPEMGSDSCEGISRPANKVSPMPRRNPPPPPSSGEPLKSSQGYRVGEGSGQLGAFWATQHAKDTAAYPHEKGDSKFDNQSSSNNETKLDQSCQDNQHFPSRADPSKDANAQSQPVRRSTHVQLHHIAEDDHPKDFDINHLRKDLMGSLERHSASTTESSTVFQDEAFNTFVAVLDSKTFSSRISNNSTSDKKDPLETEVEQLKEQLKQASLERAEMTSKYEKLSAICRSQRQEIQELKQALAAHTPSPSRDAMRNQPPAGVDSSSGQLLREKVAGTVFQQERSGSTLLPSEQTSWQAFTDDAKPQHPLSRHGASKSVRTRNGHQTKQGAGQVASDFDTWGFGAESFTAAPSAAHPQRSTPLDGGNRSLRIGESKIRDNKSDSQPAGWAGF